MTSGRHRSTVAANAWRSRTSARTSSTNRSSTRLVTKLLGPVAGASAKPLTSAPSRFSQMVSHEPLKPVCPVTRTLR